MSTARDLVSASMRLIGVLASGEAPQASEATDGLASLNRMLDSWSIENLIIPGIVRESFPLIANQQSYTMGVGGGFNTSRPIEIIRAGVEVTSNPTLEIPVDIITLEQWASVTLKSSTSSFPIALYSDSGSPLTTIKVWPIPTTTDNLIIYSAKPLSQLSGLSSSVSVPPGYEEAMIYSLAVRLAPEYGRGLTPEIMEMAVNLKASIKRQNVRPSYLKVDRALRARPGVFNWITGDTT